MGDRAEQLAHDAVEWMLAQAEAGDTGLRWRSVAGGDFDPTLYRGGAGVVMALLEAHHHFGDDRYGDAALQGARALAAAVEDEDLWASLYLGLTGMAVAMHAAGTRFDDEVCLRAARRGLERVRDAFDGERWDELFELLVGNAGIALGALHVGDVELAELAVEPYVRKADPTPGGVNWQVRPSPARSHHMAHGTLGIAFALASVAAATDRQELLELALAGVADVVSRDEEGPDGFLVPHSDPQHRPDIVERYSYGWCNGPAGDAQAFRLMAALTGDPAWDKLIDRCRHTLTHCGLPQRLRPGFWDNNGVCCGTAGVLTLACDRFADPDAQEFATLLVDDLAEHATVDDTGARWSNHEHRATPSDLEPRVGWAMGNAGIVRELIRYTRVTRGLSPGYAVQWPGHPECRP